MKNQPLIVLRVVAVSSILVACGDAPPGSPAPEETVDTVDEAFTDATTWQMDGASTQRAHVNPYDTTIGRANVASLASRWTSPASSPTAAAIVGGVAYTGSGDGTIRAIDTSSGKTLWSRNFGGTSYYAPAVGYGRVYVTVDKTLFALSATSGSFIFRADHATAVSFSAPLLADGKTFVRDANGTIWAYDAKANGRAKPVLSYAASASADPSFANGLVYVPSTDGHVYAFSSSCTGACSPSWTSAALGGPSYFPAAVWPPRLVLTVWAADGTLSEQALDASTGASLWSAPLPGATDGTGPAVGYDHAFVSLAGLKEVWALSLGDGSLSWKAPIAETPTDVPSLANQLLYVPSGEATGHLQVFDTSCGTSGATCQALRDVSVGTYGYAPSIASGTIVFSSASSTTLFALP